MREGVASQTAYRVALRRAAHQVFDDPVVFRDPLALRILGMSAERLGETELRAPKRPHSRSLRAFLVARSRFAEDTLRAAVGRGATQYVLLGAGLDTFAYRNRFAGLRVFEVDHPATQRWKRGLLEESGIAVPGSCTYVPVDFEAQQVGRELTASGFDRDRKTMFALLGVVPYLTREAFAATLTVLQEQRAESAVVLDYGLPRASLPHAEQLAFDSLARRVEAAGEPFRLFFEPEEMAERLCGAGYAVVEDLDSAAMNERYFAESDRPPPERNGLDAPPAPLEAGRGGRLRVLGSAAHLVTAMREQTPIV